MNMNHVGSDFDDFLAEEGLLEEASARALKRVVAWQLQQAMKAQRLTKKAMAERMGTSRAALDRALDENDSGMTLATLARAAQALNLSVAIQLKEQSDTVTSKREPAAPMEALAR